MEPDISGDLSGQGPRGAARHEKWNGAFGDSRVVAVPLGHTRPGHGHRTGVDPRRSKPGRSRRFFRLSLLTGERWVKDRGSS